MGPIGASVQGKEDPAADGPGRRRGQREALLSLGLTVSSRSRPLGTGRLDDLACARRLCGGSVLTRFRRDGRHACACPRSAAPCPSGRRGQPRRTRAIAGAKIKTDKIDATVLVHPHASGCLPEVEMPDARAQQRRRRVACRARRLRHRARLTTRPAFESPGSPAGRIVGQCLWRSPPEHVSSGAPGARP